MAMIIEPVTDLEQMFAFGGSAEAQQDNAAEKLAKKGKRDAMRAEARTELHKRTKRTWKPGAIKDFGDRIDAHLQMLIDHPSGHVYRIRNDEQVLAVNSGWLAESGWFEVQWTYKLKRGALGVNGYDWFWTPEYKDAMHAYLRGQLGAVGWWYELERNTAQDAVTQADLDAGEARWKWFTDADSDEPDHIKRFYKFT